MKNVKTTIDAKKKILTIEIDLTQDFGPSESGKTLIVASTEGSHKVGYEDIVLGLNAYKKNPDYKKPEKEK